jgi:CheY-like chemotaxis protein
MNAILGYCQLIQRDQSLSPCAKEGLQTIKRSGEHLMCLINGILAMSKIEAGRLTLNPTTFDLQEVLADLECLFRPRAEAKGLCLSFERSADVPRFVVADESRMREVLMNLLGNAVKFTNKGQVMVRALAQREAEPNLRLLVEIEDTGVGVSGEEIGRLFQRFEQTQSGRNAGTGTGLGLAISRELVRLMGGDITVRSQPGKGSIFQFAIRVALGNETDAAVVKKRALSRPVKGLRPGTPPLRVLLVDDVEDNRTLLVRMLGLAGFETRQALDGADGVASFMVWQPHLILMDKCMPVMDGQEAIGRIRATPEGRGVRIILLTASAFEENRQEALDAGADDYLGKPFRGEELFAKIQSLLQVEYVYADSAPAHAVSSPEIPPARLIPGSADHLPEQLIGGFREAILGVDVDRMLEMVEQIAACDAGLGREFRRLIQGFDYKKLLEILPAETHGRPTEDSDSKRSGPRGLCVDS